MNSDAEIVARNSSQVHYLRNLAAWERNQGRKGLANEIEISANCIEQKDAEITRLSARVEELERQLRYGIEMLSDEKLDGTHELAWVNRSRSLLSPSTKKE